MRAQAIPHDCTMLPVSKVYLASWGVGTVPAKQRSHKINPLNLVETPIPGNLSSPLGPVWRFSAVMGS